ncbi:hypothetical protein [Mesorhizobium sp. NZP2298]|uniref:hypothetical protein n=1 Tax=Mesorhizobium sp. NZP2298 TaxID=2483403 RepID=UPI001555DDB3|nr:hypothetical protein [Mesorhizobium sp. NZP2298]
MTVQEIRFALGEAKTNLRILAEIVSLLRYPVPKADADFNEEMASRIRSRM